MDYGESVGCRRKITLPVSNSTTRGRCRQGLPIVGTLLRGIFRRNLQNQYTGGVRRYGKIFSFQAGELPMVVISDPRIAREALSKEETAARPHFFAYRFYLYFQNTGIFFAEGQPWKENRKFVLKTLREFGFGKASSEVLIMDEMKELEDTIWPKGEQNGSTGDEDDYRDVALDVSLKAAVANVIWWMLANKRVTGEDHDFHKFLDIALSILDFKAIAIITFFPSWIPFIPGFVYGRKKMEERRKFMWNYMESVTAEHKTTLLADKPRDLIDCYLLNMKESKSDDGNLTSTFNETALTAILFELFLTGTETTSTTLKWFFLLMILHPDVQQKVHEEIDAVLGKNRTPAFDDKINMPYTDAVIHEIWRYITIAPIASVRVKKDMVIGGYNIPKETNLMINIYHVHHDPDLWKDPEEFLPERFLGPEGSFMKKEVLMPFSVGKRQCLGESLARMNAFLGAAYLMQKFSFEKIPGEEYTMERMKGSEFVRMPQPYKLRIRRRC